MKKQIRAFADSFIIAGNVIMIGFFIFIFYQSFVYWYPIFNLTTEIPAKMFWAGLFIAIVSGLMNFIKFLTDTIIKIRSESK